MPLAAAAEPVTPPHRDTVQGVTTHEETPPAIVSISDIHGYLAETRHALLTLRDHPECAPVVTADSDGRLHWAGENYVLVFNGDLIDRGPDNEGVLAMVGRLIEEAPSGRVRVTLGNHEWMVLLPDRYQFADWYSVAVATDQRRQYLQRIADGHVVAAYEGHTVTYAHAGAPDPYDVATVNESLIDAAAELADALGTPAETAVQSRLPTEYPAVLGTGDRGVKGPGAGLVWLSYEHLSTESPPQVVGHTRHEQPQANGNVYCQDILQDNLGSPGGEGVFVETPESIAAVRRTPDGGVTAATH